MANQRRKFDPERVDVWGKKKRTMTYETPNEVWFLKVIMRELPDGVFTSGEVWKTHKIKGKPWRTTRNSWWDYGLTDNYMTWLSPRLPPTYVKFIAEKLGEMVQKQCPDRGAAADGALTIKGTPKTERMEHMNYWEQHGNQPQSFWDGAKAGVEAYAWWKDGKMYVGSTGHPYDDCIAEIDDAAANCKVHFGPLSSKIKQFLEEAGQWPEKLEDQVTAVTRILTFMEDNALKMLEQYKEVLLK